MSDSSATYSFAHALCALQNATDASIRDDRGGRKRDLKAALHALRREKPNVVQIGHANGFKDLQAEAGRVAHLKACTSLVCAEPVKSKSCFSKNGTAKDGLHSVCKSCSTPEAVRAQARAVAAAKQGAQEARDAAPRVEEPRYVIEDRAVARIKSDDMTDCLVNLEFRNEDMLLPVENELRRLFYPIQVKASEDAGRAGFHRCLGYGDASTLCTMLFVHTSPKDGRRRCWVLHGDQVTSNTMSTSRSDPDVLWCNSLALRCVPPGKPLRDAILEVARTIERRVTLKEAFWNIKLDCHKTEAALMVAFRSTGSAVGFPRGNQTVVDCDVDRVDSQAKTVQDGGAVIIRHSVNGIKDQPYDEADAFEQVVVGKIWESGGKYFLTYTVIPKDTLVKHGLVTRNGVAPNTKSFRIQYGDLEWWLLGTKTSQMHVVEWTKSPLYKWRVVPLVPDGDDGDAADPAEEGGVPLSVLKDVATPVANKDSAPSTEKMLRLQQAYVDALARELEEKLNAVRKAERRIEKAATEAREQMAEHLNLARVAAEKAQAAANRAAAAAPVTYNHCTVNNNNINNIHIHEAAGPSEPPAKRLRGGTLDGYF